MHLSIHIVFSYNKFNQIITSKQVLILFILIE